jgi:hypothetical protein
MMGQGIVLNDFLRLIEMSCGTFDLAPRLQRINHWMPLQQLGRKGAGAHCLTLFCFGKWQGSGNNKNAATQR